MSICTNQLLRLSSDWKTLLEAKQYYKEKNKENESTLYMDTHLGDLDGEPFIQSNHLTKAGIKPIKIQHQ